MWNDKETDVDLLGHDKIAETVIEIINDYHLRPLTIGIYGDWGVGKSSVLSLLQKSLIKSNKAGVTNTHCILFNGWLFQGYEDAKTALMGTVVSELASLQPLDKKVQKLATSLIKRVNWLKVAKVSASALFTGLTGIPDPGAIGGLLGLLKKGKELIDPTKDDNDEGETKITVKKDDNESFFKDIHEETIIGQIAAFREEFKELIATSKVDHIIVLVDDLDRCLPKSVIDILEAIRLFLFVEGTTFVISADEKMIEYAVREHFPDLPANYSDYTRNYLEKLIQIPIRVPLLNSFQTANYIKFLMLQNYLKHDYSQLERVYTFYNGKKKNPYDNIPLSYQIITDALGTTASDLQESIFVGDRLSPTLSIGLKGNPRNIKRFLNTLFLRMRIAKIYGLEGIIKLNILAKLMLLERFQPERFDAIINEISTTQDGISAIVKERELFLTAKPEKKSADFAQGNEANDDKYDDWLKLEPALGDVDMRPYIFISKEKAISFDSDATFPVHLLPLLEQLSSNSQIVQKAAGKAIKTISLSDATILFVKLESESRSAEVKKLPPAISGMLTIVESHPSLEERLVKHISSYPSANIGPWAVTQLTGLKTARAIEMYKELLQSWSKQDGNRTLKSTATQTLKSY